ncbi:hypothetical protein BJ742DRAFT_900551, partial [Cladochytrium replicatum]
SCKVCQETVGSSFIEAEGIKFHDGCFVCYQCLEPFPEGEFYAAEGGFYCKFDHNILFGERCSRCGELIIDKCVTALGVKWHPEHFTCTWCDQSFEKQAFVKYNGKPFHRTCAEKASAKEKKTLPQCSRCGSDLQPKKFIVFGGGLCHPHHFNCAMCKEVLKENCKEHEGKLYCPADYELITSPVCHTCKRPIKGRSITAFGKQYHPEHFVCSRCEKPFENGLYWEFRNKPLCEMHYNEQTGNVCGHCHGPPAGKVIKAMNRSWCENHFVCMGCFGKLTGYRVKHIEWDMKPFCSTCFNKLPYDVKRRVNTYAEFDMKLQKLMQKA